MSIKTAGVGHFLIPTAPAAGTSCTSGAANVFTTTYVQLIASTSAALYITGIQVESAAALAATYVVVQLATGAAASETIVGQYLVPLSTASTVAIGFRPIWPPIPVATTTRIACKTADSVGAKATLITLECLAQSNYVDDGVAVTSVTTVTNLTNAPTAGDLTAAMKTSVTTAATSSTPTVTLGNVSHGGAASTLTLGGAGGLTATHTGNTTGSVGSVTGAVGSVTGAVGSVTAGVTLAASQHCIVDSGTVTTLTNLPAITAGWLTATGIANSALNGKGDWLLSSGYTVAPTVVQIRTEMDTNSTKLANLDATISSRSTYSGGAVASVTGAVGSVTAAVTVGTNNDKTGYSLAGTPNVNISTINGVTVTGSGTSIAPWGA